MKKIIIVFLLISPLAYAQKVNKLIKEENVTRVISTLAADDMMGRPADNPQYMEKATAFIEAEFKKIGLKPLTGLTGFRQEFREQERISPDKIEVSIDGEAIGKENVLLISEKKEIQLNRNLTIKTIPFDNSATNLTQAFRSKAVAIYRDTVSSIVLVAPEFAEAFKDFKDNLSQRFARGDKSTKVFVLGKTTATTYSVKASQKIEGITFTNVVGVLEGKTKPDEMVVFSAHYDHLGIEGNEADSIANGADDDASGTTAVIELARYFKKMKK